MSTGVCFVVVLAVVVAMSKSQRFTMLTISESTACNIYFVLITSNSVAYSPMTWYF